MHTYLIEMLECPACHGKLEWNIIKQDENRIEAAEAHCEACTATYPVRDGIGLFPTPELSRNDLWEQGDTWLFQHLRKHPEIERQLMETPLDALAPADQLFRADVLEERGNYIEARIIEDSAKRALYTPEYRDCMNSQLDYVVEWLSTTDGPIVDLASGRCGLVERLVRRLERRVVATDFSPRVLRKDRRWLESFGLYERVSLLAFDARRTPFRDGAVDILTTHLGLPNIDELGNVLRELQRIVTGVFLAVSHFYPENDEANAKAIRESGSETALYRHAALEHYAAAGWEVEVRNACRGEARPTPFGTFLEGCGVDGLPVADTNLEWCVLLATNKVLDSKQGTA